MQFWYSLMIASRDLEHFHKKFHDSHFSAKTFETIFHSQIVTWYSLSFVHVVLIKKIVSILSNYVYWPSISLLLFKIYNQKTRTTLSIILFNSFMEQFCLLTVYILTNKLFPNHNSRWRWAQETDLKHVVTCLHLTFK